MILETLEYASRSPFAEKIEVKSPLTVEHVLPQSAADSDWPLESKPAESESEARQRRSMILHTLGNLTLLTQPLNSSESNGPYSKKRPEIAKQSLLALNSYFQDAKDWGEAEILKRGEKLADLAVVIWPSPKT